MPVYKVRDKKLYFWKEVINGKQIKRTNKNWNTSTKAQADLDNFKKTLDNNNELILNASFQLVANKYIDFLDLKCKKSTKQRTAQMINKYIIPHFGNKKIRNINLNDIERFQKGLLGLTKEDGTPYKNSYIERIQTMTRQIFDYAVAHSYISTNPFYRTVITRHNHLEEKHEISILTYEEYKKFMSVVDDEIDRVAFSILYWCGLRSGELLALTLKDYDRETKLLTINKNYDTKNKVVTVTKNRLIRVIEVPDECAKELDILYDTIDDIEELKDNPIIGIVTYYSKTSFTRKKDQYIKESGVKRFTFHDLRHTHVSTLIDIGWEAKDIADRLGHSVAMVNDTYGHLFPSRVESNMKKLNAISKF